MADPITEALNHLEAVARAATPGPWRLEPVDDDVFIHAHNGTLVSSWAGDEDAAFIAALNPERALQLIEVVRAAERYRAEVHSRDMRAADELREIAARRELFAALMKIGAPHG